MSYKEYSVENNIFIEQPGVKKFSEQDETVSSNVVNDRAAFDLPPDNVPGFNGRNIQTNREKETPSWEQIQRIRC